MERRLSLRQGRIPLGTIVSAHVDDGPSSAGGRGQPPCPPPGNTYVISSVSSVGHARPKTRPNGKVVHRNRSERYKAKTYTASRTSLTKVDDDEDKLYLYG